MNKVGILALSSLQETLKDRLLAGLLLLGTAILIALVFMAPMTLGARDKTYHDFGLAWIHLSAFLILIVLGAWSLHRERERGIWVIILARPVTRGEYLLGRSLGLLGGLVMTVLAFTALYLLISHLAGIAPLPGLHWALLYTIMEMSILAGLVIFFSSVSGFAMTVFLSLAVFLAGHLAGDLIRFASLTESPALAKAALAMHWFLPQLEIYRIRDGLVSGAQPSAAAVGQAVLYTLLYGSALFVLSLAAFGRKELR